MPKALSQRASHRRLGGVTVEMVLVVVVLVIATVGIVHFGVFFANAQQVALAARAGALKASQQIHLPSSSGQPVPPAVLAAVAHQLESSDISYCRVRLEHNATPTQDAIVLNSPSEEACDCRSPAPLPPPVGGGSRYVRLTVCVPLREVFPQNLSFFGVQLYESDKTYEHSAIYRYELDLP
jgi:hypothetical protein